MPHDGTAAPHPLDTSRANVVFVNDGDWGGKGTRELDQVANAMALDHPFNRFSVHAGFAGGLGDMAAVTFQ